MKPLQGIKVVELATYVAAPSCPRILADWGAEVVKIEAPGGDPLRTQAGVYGMPLLDDEPVAFDFCSLNKKFVSLNLKSSEGMEACLKLIESADVLVTNFRTKALVKLGLDYDTLKKRFPRLVWAQMLGYGLRGPEKDTPGYDVTSYVARGGILGSFHERGTSPINEPNAFGDYQASVALAGGICGALLGRERSGKGDRVTVALQHLAVFAMTTAICSSQYGNSYPKSRRDVPNPMNCTYKSKDDRWFILCLPDYDKDYARFMKLIGLENLAEDPRFIKIADLAKDNANTTLIDIVAEAMLTKTLEEWSSIFKNNDVPFERAYLPEEILEDENAWANEYLRKIKYPSGNERVLTTTPIQFESIGLPDAVLSKPVGHHTEEVLVSLGYSKDQVRSLQEKGAVK